MISLFILGLAAVAIGPILALLTDDAEAGTVLPASTSAGMFVALNDNARVGRRAA